MENIEYALNNTKIKNTDVKNVFEKIKPNIIINCAAYTNVDLAETTGYDDACKINIYAVELLSKYCKEYNCLLIHLLHEKYL